MAATAKAMPAAKDTSTWLTRVQACDLLDCAHTTLLRLEREGKLHPELRKSDVSGRTVFVYDPKELANVPRRSRMTSTDRESEREARAIEMFDLGRSINQVIVEIRESSARVRAWHEAWLDNGGAAMQINDNVKAELEPLIGEFQNTAELIERVRALATKGSKQP